jgi:thioredoxin 1
MIKEIIKFGAPWCQGCISADTALEQLEAMRPEIIISKINIEEDETMAEKYKVRGLPTLVLIGLDGKEIGRHTGKITIQELIQIVDGNGL